MTYHVVFNRRTDLASISQQADQGLNPRHSMAALTKALDARVHDGSGLDPGLLDRVLGKLTRSPPFWWAIARAVRREAAPGDVIYCVGEDIGVPVAAACGGRPGVSIALTAHFIDRLKGRLALRLFGLRRRVALFYTVARPQAAFLRAHVGADRVRFIWDQTDTQFFVPGPASPGKTRSIVASVGLEMRDYSTLARATAGLDIDVRISGYSADTRVLARAFPEAMPANMTQRFYPWPELLQLYRDADIVVVSLFPNRHAAGVQALMEALACGRPVIATATEGLDGYLDCPEAIRLVPPGDVDRLRDTIANMLAEPDERACMAERAAALAHERYRFETHVETLAASLRALAAC